MKLEKKILIFLVCKYKMVVVTVEFCKNASVHTMTVKNKELFWMKIIDLQGGLGLKNMPDLSRKGIQGIFETKDPTEEQKKKIYKD